MRALGCLLLCLALALARAQQNGAPAPLQTREEVLQPFVEVDTCLPINVLVQPNATADAYSIRLEAEPAVLQVLSWNVTNRALQLATTGEFTTSRPIKITVTMPATRLQAINHQGTGAEVYVAPGFNVRAFVAAASFGAGRLYINQMVARNATLQMSGTGDTVLIGSFGSVNVTSTGTGGVYVAGANDTVSLDLRGVSNAFVQPARPTAAITGTATGINVVQYTDGTCDVRSQFPFLSTCQAVPFISAPSPNAVWTCGLQVRGSFACTSGGTAYTSSASGFVGASGPAGTVPVTTTTPAGTSAFTPSSFQFAGASPGGQGAGTQQQAGSVSPQGTQASSNIAGTGSVSATSVAGPGGAQTSTTQGGQSTQFQTTGQQTTGGTTGGAAGTQGAAQPSPTSASSTAFSTASPTSSSMSATVSSGGQTTSIQGAGSGVIRVGADGQSQATATSQACQATATELRMPTQGTP